MMDKGDQSVNFDGEAEIDKLLMMHMSKHYHDDEVPPTIQIQKSSSPKFNEAFEMDPPLTRDSSKKKR